MSETFGKYKLVRKLASGGMGEILLATQKGPEGFERRVAIKRILPAVSANREFVTMFLDEARLVASFNHPNIVQIFDFGKAKGTYYLAMEFLRGASLHQVLKCCAKQGRAVPIDHTVKLISQACQGLDYAHNYTSKDGTPLNLIHRDVSPHNLMLTYDGMVKLLDFGVAKAKSNVSKTRGDSIKGKIAFMSPEQVKGGARLDRRSDLFSLGIVMYMLLTGKTPFPGRSDYEYMDAIVKRTPTDPRHLKPDIPVRLVEVVLRALEKNPAKRYPTARELMIDLEQFLVDQRLVVDAYRLGQFLAELLPPQTLGTDLSGLDLPGARGDAQPQRRAQEPPSTAPTGPTTKPLKASPPDRRRLVIGLLAGLIVAGAAALGLLLLDPLGTDTPPPDRPGPEPVSPPDLGEESDTIDLRPTGAQEQPGQEPQPPAHPPRTAKRKPGSGRRNPKVRIQWPASPLIKVNNGRRPGDPPAASPDADQLAADALEAQRNGQNRLAVALYRKAIRKNPKDPELTRMMANAYAKAGADDEAILYYRRYLKSCPGCPFTADVQKRLTELEAERTKSKEAPVSQIQWPSTLPKTQNQPSGKTPAQAIDEAIEQSGARPGSDMPDLIKLNEVLRRAQQNMHSTDP